MGKVIQDDKLLCKGTPKTWKNKVSIRKAEVRKQFKE